MEVPKQSTLTPPYLSILKLNKLIETISSRNIAQISLDHFTSRDFSKADAYLAMGTLRFLGLILENGETTESLKKFQLIGDQRKKAVEGVIKTAYSKLFATFIDKAPYDVDEKELINEFTVQYGMSQRTAPSAVKAFLWLCGKAGLVEDTIKIQNRTKKENGVNTTKKNNAFAHRGGTNMNSGAFQHNREIETGVTLTLAGGISVFVPNSTPNVSNAIAVGELKNAVEALNLFASKFLLKTEGEDGAAQNI